MDTKDFTYLQELLQSASGLVLETGKAYLVELRLTPVARQRGYVSIDALVSASRDVPSGAGLRTAIVEAMMTHETTFFRDSHPFEALKTVVIPELMRKRAGERRLNFWCAATSSGQEPYSLAMLLQEHFPMLATWSVHILATDLSDQVLERARRGVYSALEIHRGLPPALLQKYFEEQSNGWQIKETLRRKVDFRQMNLVANSWSMLDRMDVVLMRNVLIYFGIPTKQTILAKMEKALRPDGYLFLGGAETTLNLSQIFERVPPPLSGCFRMAQPPPVLSGSAKAILEERKS